MQTTLTENPPTNRQMLKNIGNIVLMLIVFWTALLLCTLLMSREVFVEMSGTYFSPDIPPLLESSLLSVLLRKEFMVIPILIVTGMIVKEFKISPLRKRVYWNLVLLSAVVVHFGLLGYLIFKPAFNASC